MKRLFALLLALCMILCLCACAQDTVTKDDDDDAVKRATGSTEPTVQDPQPSSPADDTKPTSAYDKLYAYIQSNGEAQDDAWVCTLDTFTMAAGADGSIIWAKPSVSGTMIWALALTKDGSAPSFSVSYMTYTASAILEDDGGTLSDFRHSAPAEYAENMRTFLESGISYLLNDAKKALEPAGLTLDSFIPPAAS